MPTATECARAANDGALLVPLTSAVAMAGRAAIVVSGKDRITWLNGLVTCDLSKHAAYGFLVEKKGKIQTDFFAVPSDDTLLLAVPANLREQLVATLDHYLIMENAELSEGDHAFYLMQGKAARAVADRVPELAAANLDLWGAGGVVLAVRGAEAEHAEKALVAAGATLADASTFHAVRVEHGLPWFGVEVDTSFYPQEAGLETLGVSFDKGCYLGQEVVYMLQNRGHVKKKLVPLAIDGAEPIAGGTAVTTPEGEAAGDVKTAVVAPSDGAHVAAIAMLKWNQAKSGTELRIGDRIARVR